MIDYLNIQDVLDIKYLNKNYYRYFGEFIDSVIYIKSFSLVKEEDIDNIDEDSAENNLNVYLIINVLDKDLDEYNIKTKSKVLIIQFKNLLDVLKNKQAIAEIQSIKNRVTVNCLTYIAAKCEKVALKNKNNKNSFYYKINSTAV